VTRTWRGAHVFVGKISPVSRPFTELAGQTFDRVHRKCASSSSRIWLNVPPIGRLLSKAASAGGVRYVSRLTFLLEVLPTGYSTRCTDVVPPKHISKAQSHHLRGRCCNCTDDPGLSRRRFRWYNARIIRAVHTAHVPSSDFAVTVAQHHRPITSSCTLATEWRDTPTTTSNADAPTDLHSLHSSIAPRSSCIFDNCRGSSIGHRAANPLDYVVGSRRRDNAAFCIICRAPRTPSRSWPKCRSARQSEGARRPSPARCSQDPGPQG
jgi:hypothetical protein